MHTRGNDYLSRIITSQNGKEYDYRNYDGMKKAYVIWILPQVAKKRDGHVNRINSKLENISGSAIERLESYDKGEQITNLMNSLSISFSKAVELLKVSKDKVLEIEKYFKS